MMRDIYEEVGEPAALELVAEEAAELAQACLKLSRILRRENPTPVPKALAVEKVMEEAADVQTALSVLSSAQWYDEDKVMHIQWKKSERWKERLRKRERLGNGQRTGNNLVNKSGGLAKDLVDDCISRQAAINAIWHTVEESNSGELQSFAEACIADAEVALKALPPAQQTALTADDIETIRIHLSAFKEELCNQGRWTEAEEYERLMQRLTGKGGQDGSNTENDLVKKQGDLVNDLVNDTISRTAALNACRNPEDGENAYAYGDEIEKRLKALPPPPGCEDAVSRDALDILIEEAQTAWLKGDILLMYPALKKGLKKVPPVTPKQPGCEDAVPRTSVEYICRKNTVSTNPYEHKYHDKFIQFMDDPEISDFGRWQHSNGFNTALVAVECDLDKVPSVTPKQPGWIPGTEPQKGEENG